MNDKRNKHNYTAILTVYVFSALILLHYNPDDAIIKIELQIHALFKQGRFSPDGGGEVRWCEHMKLPLF